MSVMEPGLPTDDELGALVLKVPDVLDSLQVSRWTGKEQAGYMKGWMALGNGDGAEIELEVEFLP